MKYLDDGSAWYSSEEVRLLYNKAKQSADCGYVIDDVITDVLQDLLNDFDSINFEAVGKMAEREYYQSIEDTNIIYEKKGFIAGFNLAMIIMCSRLIDFLERH